MNPVNPRGLPEAPVLSPQYSVAGAQVGQPPVLPVSVLGGGVSGGSAVMTHSSLGGGLPSPFSSGIYQGSPGFSASPHPGFLLNHSHQAAAAYGCRMLLSGAFGQTPGTVVVDNTTGQPVGIVTPCPPVPAPSGLASPPHNPLFGHSLPNLLPRPPTPQQIMQMAPAAMHNAANNSNSPTIPKNFLLGAGNALLSQQMQPQKKYHPLLPSTTHVSQPVSSTASYPVISTGISSAVPALNTNTPTNTAVAAFPHLAAASGSGLFPSGLAGVPGGVSPFPGTAPVPCVLANGVPTVLMRTSTGAIVAVPLQAAYSGLNVGAGRGVQAAPPHSAGGSVTTYPPILPHPPGPVISESSGGTDSAPSLPLSEATPTDAMKEGPEENGSSAPPVVQSLPASSILGPGSDSNASEAAAQNISSAKKPGKRSKKSLEKPPKILHSPTLDTSDMPKLLPGDLYAPTDTDIRSIFMQEVEKNAAYRPGVLTHVIDGFLIQESTEPFPVSTFPLESFIPQEAFEVPGHHMEMEVHLHHPPQLKPEIAEETDMSPCLQCGKCQLSLAPEGLFEKDTRFCSRHCYKKHRKRQKKCRGESLTSASGLEEEDNNEESSFHIDQGIFYKLRGVKPPSSKKSRGSAQDEGSRAGSSRMETTPFSSPQPMGGEEISPRLPSPDKHPRDWTVEEVYGWVLSLGPGVANSSEVFKREEIDGAALMLLEEDHLVKSLGIKLGPAVKIAAALKTLKGFPR